MPIRISNDSRVREVMENYERIHGKEKALLLDALVFMSMNVISVRGTAQAIAPERPIVSHVLTMNAGALMQTIIDLSETLHINRLDLMAAIGGLCKDIGEHRAQSD